MNPHKLGTVIFHSRFPRLRGRIIGHALMNNPWNNQLELHYLVQLDVGVRAFRETPDWAISVVVMNHRWALVEELPIDGDLGQN